MGNYLSIATVTATIQRTLQVAIQADVDGARTTTVRPNEIGSSTPETGVNIFLYQIITNPVLQNMDAAPLRARGNPVKRQAALDLYYMISFYGNDNELTPQRLVGSVVQTLNDNRVISQEMVRETCEDSTFTFLRNANLGNQIQQISITPLDLNLEDLSKAWSVFFQTPYILSMAYKVMVVLIEGEEPFKRALPVRDRQLGGAAAPLFNRPAIEQVVSQRGRFEPIVATSTIVIKGKHLKGDRFTQVRIGNVEIIPPSITDTEIVLPLSMLPIDALEAGMQPLQVIHATSLAWEPSTASPRKQGTESNVAPIVVCPSIQEIHITHLEGMEDELRSGVLTVRSDFRLGQRQRVAVALNEWSTQNPVAYLFEADPRDADTHSVTVPLRDVKPAEYLVRLQVDGAESPLQVDDAADSPTFEWYIGPKVLIV